MKHYINGNDYSLDNLASTLVYGEFSAAGRLVGSVQPVYAIAWGWDVILPNSRPVGVIHGGIDCPLSVRDVVYLARSVCREYGIGYRPYGGGDRGDVSMVAVYRKGAGCLGAWVHNQNAMYGSVEFLPWSDAFRQVVAFYGMNWEE